jgi:hypothetical protein
MPINTRNSTIQSGRTPASEAPGLLKVFFEFGLRVGLLSNFGQNNASHGAGWSRCKDKVRAFWLMAQDG